MAEWHLRELESCLAERGWRIVAVHPGDGYRISGTWELERGRDERILLDFEGLDPDRDDARPLAEAYGCDVRGRPSPRLYFGKRAGGNRPRGSWERELAEFLKEL